MAHDFGNDEVSSAQIPVPDRQEATAALPHDPAPAFEFAHHPISWFKLGDEYLPRLVPFARMLGVNGVDAKGSTTLAHVMMAERGWKAIPRNLTPDGTDYLAAYRTRSGGVLHVSRWERPRHLGGRVMAPDVDRDGYHDWLRWLVSEGHIAPIDPAVRKKLDQRDRTHQGRRSQRLRRLGVADEPKGEAKPKAGKGASKSDG